VKIENGFSLKPPSPEVQAEKRDNQLKQAAKMYETHFLNEMVKAMRSTVGQEDGLIKRGMGEKIFSEQLDQQYVDSWADKGGVGLADMIYTQIKERYMGSHSKGGGGMPPKPEMLPIAPQKNMHGIGPSESIQMKMLPASPGGKLGYRFEVPAGPEQARPAGTYDVVAPMAARVAELKSLPQGWSAVRLDHGQGVMSELTFPGTIGHPETNCAEGSLVAAGHKLGIMDSSRLALAWNLDWT
jgi:flagellar protein FlgJ